MILFPKVASGHNDLGSSVLPYALPHRPIPHGTAIDWTLDLAATTTHMLNHKERGTRLALGCTVLAFIIACTGTVRTMVAPMTNLYVSDA